MLKYSAFSLSVVDSLGDTALAYSLIAARWAVLSYDWYAETFFSDKAQQRYEEIGTIIGTMMVVAVAAGMTARIIVEDLAGDLPAADNANGEDSDDVTDYMEDDLPSLYELFEKAEAIHTDYAPSLSHEDYLDRKIELEGMTLKALVPIAEDLNLVTRKVRKEVLVEAILKAEGYEA
jgi:hypothetical protein